MYATNLKVILRIKSVHFVTNMVAKVCCSRCLCVLQAKIRSYDGFGSADRQPTATIFNAVSFAN